MWRPRGPVALALTTSVVAVLSLVACGEPASLGGDPPPAYEGCGVPGSGIVVGGVGQARADTPATPVRRVVLMGGGSEDDAAMELFLEAAGGGDVLVMRASGSVTSYPSYFDTGLSPSPAPATALTVRTDEPGAAADPVVFCHLERADAVWLAGGNQWNYLGLWPDTVRGALAGLTARGVPVGGTSAGSMSLGEGAFDAEYGGITSADALADPLAPEVSVSYPRFAVPELEGVLVDSHFADRDREGRLLAFLGRFLTEQSRTSVVGLGLDERVAFVVEAGRYTVSTDEDGAAWLYEVRAPVTLTAGEPLDLGDVRVARLPAGREGEWPFDFDGPGVGALVVEDGVVRRIASAAPTGQGGGR